MGLSLVHATHRGRGLKCLKRHRVQELMREANRRAFITPDLCPSNSHDFNPVDYKIWGIIQ